jgi:uncharacterized protein
MDWMPHFPAPLVVAFLLELVFYFATCTERARRAAETAFSKGTLAMLVAVSAVLPYCLYSLCYGCFHPWQMVALVALAGLVSVWYLILPRHPLIDAAFLALMAVVTLSSLFGYVYTSVDPKLPASVLGRLMLIRVGVMAVLSFRGMEGVGLGLIPKWKEWLVGVQQYLLYIPIAAALAFALGFAHFQVSKMPWWMIPLTFLGMLWVVALSEEFLVRGLLLQWLRDWTGREQTALIISSVIFGLAHLPFRGFPNWKFALLATVAGWFYGRAYLKTGSIRAAMVAHALTNVTWRVFFVLQR